jgi:hypothetical protein
MGGIKKLVLAKNKKATPVSIRLSKRVADLKVWKKIIPFAIL